MTDRFGKSKLIFAQKRRLTLHGHGAGHVPDLALPCPPRPDGRSSWTIASADTRDYHSKASQLGSVRRGLETSQHWLFNAVHPEHMRAVNN